MRFFSCCLRLAVVAYLATASVAMVRADEAKPFLNGIFTDNMVLQRGISDPVWGWTTPGQAVTVQIAGKSATARAGTDGEWMVKLAPLPVGGPYDLVVTGPQTVTLKNVLVGDVWICSGQSNMSFTVSSALNAQTEIAAANYPKLRLFMQASVVAPEPQFSAAGQWAVCTPQAAEYYSAVGYFFGRDLQQDINVPVGMICAAWPGSPAQAWTSRDALVRNLPEFLPAVAGLDPYVADKGLYQHQLDDWYAANDPGTPANWQSEATDDTAWTPITLPGYFQDAGIPELANINGIVWFRKTFDLPAGDAGKSANLHVTSDDYDTTWVNGTEVGTGSWAHSYPVPASLLKSSGNTVAVRILDEGGKGGLFGDAANLSLEVPGGQSVPLAGAWRCKLGIPLTKMAAQPHDIPNDPFYPTELYNGMISPLIPFGIKGVVWYQGESNAGQAKQYETLLPAMIADWRTRFDCGDFPFLIVQLANVGTPPVLPLLNSNWAELREAQFLISQRVPMSGLALAVDIGDPNDVHPKNKQEVARRLELTAQAVAYGRKVEYAGPTYKSMAVEGGAIRLRFTHIGGGLVAKGSDGLTGFYIAGADGQFVAADARIDKDTILVSAPTVSIPATVRYAWADCPVCSLYNAAGLPGPPFRTDMPK